MDIEVSPDGTVKYSVWWKNGSMLVNRQYLAPDHPESLYQQFLKNGLIPEDYGLKSFNEEVAEEFRVWNKDRLINEILYLRKTILMYERFC